METEVQKAQVLIDTYQKVVDAWGRQAFPANVSASATALTAGLVEVASSSARGIRSESLAKGT